MPITGTFEADFTQFLAATQAASKELEVFSKTADSSTNAVTKLENATKSHVGTAGTLRTAYQSFDGILNSLGVHIGPQITALEELGSAAGKTASQLGLVGSAGLIVGTAMAAWQTGKWIGQVTGWTKAIQDGTATLLGYGDVANETAQAVDQSIVLAFKRTGVWARDGAEALKLNTQWAKENATQAKFNAESTKAAAEQHAKWEAAVEAVTAAGKGYQAILKGIDAATVEAAKSELRHGAVLADVATAHKLTDTQARALTQSIEAEKKATDDAAAAVRAFDASLMVSYNTQIKIIADLNKARAEHFGIDEQIKQLEQLEAAEQRITDATIAQLTSEQDKMKVEEANAKRRTEIEIDIGKLREQQTAIIAASTLRAIGLQTELNKAYGLDARGAILLPQDAMTEYQKKVDTINRTMQDGIEKTNALKLANQQLSDAFLKDAQAADAATNAIATNTAIMYGSLATAQSLVTAKSLQRTPEAYPSAVGGGSFHLSDFQLHSGFRAAGGPVSAGNSYIVGERGPELFMPSSSGAILPNVGAGGRGIQIVINGNVLSTQAELAALVGQAMIEAYRRGGNRLPV